jgi:hypothetical protein
MQNGCEYPSQMPEGTTPEASNWKPGGWRTNNTTIRQKLSGARGRGAVGSGGVRGKSDMLRPMTETTSPRCSGATIDPLVASSRGDRREYAQAGNCTAERD